MFSYGHIPPESHLGLICRKNGLSLKPQRASVGITPRDAAPPANTGSDWWVPAVAVPAVAAALIPAVKTVVPYIVSSCEFLCLTYKSITCFYQKTWIWSSAAQTNPSWPQVCSSRYRKILKASSACQVFFEFLVDRGRDSTAATEQHLESLPSSHQGGTGVFH